MGFFNVKKTYNFCLSDAEIKENILNFKTDSEGYLYMFNEIEKDTYIAKPKSQAGSFRNSFAPIITLHISENKAEVNFELMKVIRNLIVFCCAYALLIELFLIYLAVNNALVNIFYLFIPLGVILIALLFSCGGLRISQKIVEKEIISIFGQITK